MDMAAAAVLLVTREPGHTTRVIYSSVTITHALTNPARCRGEGHSPPLQALELTWMQLLYIHWATTWTMSFDDFKNLYRAYSFVEAKGV